MKLCDNCKRPSRTGTCVRLENGKRYCPDCVRAYLVGYEAAKADAEEAAA